MIDGLISCGSIQMSLGMRQHGLSWGSRCRYGGQMMVFLVVCLVVWCLVWGFVSLRLVVIFWFAFGFHWMMTGVLCHNMMPCAAIDKLTLFDDEDLLYYDGV